MDNKGKYALVTGATSGIGHELAKLLAADGYNLVIVGRDQTTLDSTASALNNGSTVVTIQKDLFEPEAAAALYQEVKSKGINIDVLVNDAGQGIFGKFIENELDRELDIIQLNISSLVVLTKHFVKDMVARGEGKVLNLSSIASKVPGPYQAVYHGTKAFVQSFTEAIRSELKDTGVTVTALLPGVTDTDFFNKADMLDSKAVQDKDDMADAAKVAKDGYEAMLSGKDMVISGLKNKLQVGMANFMPDSLAAEQMKKQQEPVDESKK